MTPLLPDDITRTEWIGSRRLPRQRHRKTSPPIAHPRHGHADNRGDRAAVRLSRVHGQTDIEGRPHLWSLVRDVDRAAPSTAS